MRLPCICLCKLLPVYNYIKIKNSLHTYVIWSARDLANGLQDGHLKINPNTDILPIIIFPFPL